MGLILNNVKCIFWLLESLFMGSFFLQSSSHVCGSAVFLSLYQRWSTFAKWLTALPSEFKGGARHELTVTGSVFGFSIR